MGLLTFPTFAADGRRLRNRSAESCARLEELKLAVIVRTRRGVIVSCHFYGESRQPLQARFRAGSRYSFREPVAYSHVWALTQLPRKAIDAQLEYLANPEVIEEHLKALYCAVPLSCMPDRATAQGKLLPMVAPIAMVEKPKRRRTRSSAWQDKKRAA